MSLIAGWRAPTIKDDYFALVVKRWLVCFAETYLLLNYYFWCVVFVNFVR